MLYQKEDFADLRLTNFVAKDPNFNEIAALKTAKKTQNSPKTVKIWMHRWQTTGANVKTKRSVRNYHDLL